MAQTPLEKNIELLISPAIESMGYEIVRIKLMEGSKSKTLQIMAENHSSKEFGVGDCAKISRAVSAILDVEEPVPGEYSLEVSSPGIDRPLVKLRDFERFIGFDAKIETKQTIRSRKRFKGRLTGVNDDRIEILVDSEAFHIPYPDVHKAKLLLTDKLISAFEEKQA